jgi:hypothetical protein
MYLSALFGSVTVSGAVQKLACLARRNSEGLGQSPAQLTLVEHGQPVPRPGHPRMGIHLENWL